MAVFIQLFFTIVVLLTCVAFSVVVRRRVLGNYDSRRYPVPNDTSY